MTISLGHSSQTHPGAMSTIVHRVNLPLRPLPIDNLLRFLAQTQGRDKLYRLVQYFSRFLAFYLTKMSPSSEFVQRIQKLSVSVGLARKLFRVGKPLDNLQIILKSSAIKDELERSFVVGKALGFGGWLTLDAFQWLNAQGILKLSPGAAEFVNKNAPRLWFLGLISSLSMNLYKIHRLHPQLKATQFKELQNISGLPAALRAVDTETRQAAKDALQDLVDLIIPLSLMGAIDVNAGVVGAAGTFTSILGITSLWPKK